MPASTAAAASPFSPDAATVLTGTATAAATANGILQPGDPFGTRYRILRILGAGGMGVVYQAWDSELGVAVALKVIRPETMANPETAHELERRFKRELLLARQVTHKNVVRIHDLGEVHGTKYLTMPFIDGRDLAALLRESGQLPVARALDIARQIAAGLEAAHDAGVVHRDLKPENVMLDEDGHAVIMDFGISRSTTGTGAGTVAGAVVGTLEYMAPEQARGAAADQRVDIYAFGLMLYDMLAGRGRVGSADGAVSEMLARITHPPAPLRTRVAHVPEAVERIVSRCVDPEPGQRFQTSAELLAALEALDANGNPKATQEIASPRMSRRTIAAAIAAVVLLTGTVAGLLWFRAGPPAAATAAARDPVSVLISDFENQAQDPVFEGLVEQALAIGVEGASFVTVFPRVDALRLASTVTGRRRLDAQAARLLASREGIDVVVLGTISRDGTGFKLSARALRPQSDGADRPILESSVAASGHDEVLSAVGKLATRLRAALGDVTADTGRADDAETFTAASLEAAQAYASAQEASWAGDAGKAIERYEKALSLDPELGRAYSGLAALYANQGRRDEAADYYQRALTKIDRMTEREKYRTRGGYYLFARNPTKAIEEFQVLVEKYPADSAAMANLAVAMLLERRTAQAQQIGRRAVEIYPRNVVRRSNAALFAMYAGDFASAEKLAGEALKLNPDYPKAHVALAVSQFAQGRSAEAGTTWRKLAALPAGTVFGVGGLADQALAEGRIADAVALLEALPDPVHPRLLALLAEARLLQGTAREAATAAEAAAAGSDDPAVLFLAGRVLADAKRPRAVEIAATLESRVDREARIDGALLRGEIALARGDARAAIDAFTDAQKFLDTWMGRYGLGRASLAAGALVDADRDFEACLSRRGEATAVFLDDVSTYRLIPDVYYYVGLTQAGQGRPAWRETLNTFLSIKAAGDEQGLVTDARRRLDQR